MADGQYELTLARHIIALTMLIAQGEQILFFARKVGLRPFLDFTIEDLEATLESLSTTLRCQHGPKNHPTTNESIQKLLNFAEPNG